MATIATPNGFNLDSSGKRVVVDPVTRIEGHMRCEVNLDANNVIRNAVSTGTMWRGLEVILKGRDPRDAWAFVQRICGVCTGTHALTSVRAVENALGIDIPENANSIRNIMQLSLQVHDHLVHFYHLHALDWVNPVNALKADPKATSELQQKVSPSHPNSSPGYFRDVQTRLRKFVESGQLGPFKNGYWTNPAYKLPPEADLMAVTHYLEALDFQKEIMRVRTIFGGKDIHPNWLVGGVPCAINIDGDMAAGAPINMASLNYVIDITQRCIEFVENVYIPDLMAIASYYKGWLYGGGLSNKSLLAYGDIPDKANDYSPANLLMPRGAIINGKLNEVHPVDLADLTQVQEFVPHSWYKYEDESKGLHPWDGVTEPHYELGKGAKGTSTRIEEIDESAKYSWIKAPRWRGHAMEVGPLARYVIGYMQGNKEIKEQVDWALKTLDVPMDALFSTLGRTAARGLEAQWAARKQVFPRQADRQYQGGRHIHRQHRQIRPQDMALRGQGRGLYRGAARALGHWIRIKDGKIDNYQCVVPTTWNGSPRDNQGNIGAFEASLMNTKVERAEEPVEILRTLHSFDPCLACSTHVMGPDGQEMAQVKVR
jgi:hydrogenase large subunit